MTFVPRSILNHKHVIPMTWENQMNGATSDYWRMCYSSSSSMFVNHFNPGVLKNHPKRREGEQLDDFYLRMLKEVAGGDSTDTNAQMQMHRYFGVNSEFRQTGNRETLEYFLSKGHPVMTGQLHHFSYEHPDPARSHWTICIGWTPDNDSFVFHDPAGQMNVKNGGYVSNEGAYRKYAWELWKRRWMADFAGNFKEGAGWCVVPVIDKSKNGVYVPLKK